MINCPDKDFEQTLAMSLNFWKILLQSYLMVMVSLWKILNCTNLVWDAVQMKFRGKKSKRNNLIHIFFRFLFKIFTVSSFFFFFHFLNTVNFQSVSYGTLLLVLITYCIIFRHLKSCSSCMLQSIFTCIFITFCYGISRFLHKLDFKSFLSIFCNEYWIVLVIINLYFFCDWFVFPFWSNRY